MVCVTDCERRHVARSLRRMAAKHGGVAAPALENRLGLESDERFLYGAVFTRESVERLADLIEPEGVAGEIRELACDVAPEGEPLPQIVDREALLALADEMERGATPDGGGFGGGIDAALLGAVSRWVVGCARRIREALGVEA